MRLESAQEMSGDGAISQMSSNSLPGQKVRTFYTIIILCAPNLDLPFPPKANCIIQICLILLINILKQVDDEKPKINKEINLLFIIADISLQKLPSSFPLNQKRLRHHLNLEIFHIFLVATRLDLFHHSVSLLFLCPSPCCTAHTKITQMSVLCTISDNHEYYLCNIPTIFRILLFFYVVSVISISKLIL